MPLDLYELYEEGIEIKEREPAPRKYIDLANKILRDFNIDDVEASTPDIPGNLEIYSVLGTNSYMVYLFRKEFGEEIERYEIGIRGVFDTEEFIPQEKPALNAFFEEMAHLIYHVFVAKYRDPSSCSDKLVNIATDEFMGLLGARYLAEKYAKEVGFKVEIDRNFRRIFEKFDYYYEKNNEKRLISLIAHVIGYHLAYEEDPKKFEEYVIDRIYPSEKIYQFLEELSLTDYLQELDKGDKKEILRKMKDALQIYFLSKYGVPR